MTVSEALRRKLLSRHCRNKDGLRPGIREEQGNLVVGKLRIEGYDDGAQGHYREVRDHPLRAIFGKKRNAVAFFNPQFSERTGDRSDAAHEIPVGVLLIAVTRFYLDRDAIGMPVRGLPDLIQDHVMPLFPAIEKVLRSLYAQNIMVMRECQTDFCENDKIRRENGKVNTRS